MATSSSSSQHVPAWKRLGLKLKYANEIIPEIAIPSATHAKQSTGEDNHYGKRSRESDARLTPSKRAKISIEHEQHILNNGHDLAHHATSDVTTKGRRKSVTFTSDTKKDDGFSATTLYQNWLANEHEAQSSHSAHDGDQVPTVQKLEPTASKPENKTEKKPKRDKTKSKTDKAAKTARIANQPDSGEIPDFVRYLVQFHQDKSTWKFHKKKQNELIKHCFDLERIPAEHTPALVEYVKGLQSAGVQQRLVESSERILQDLLARQDQSGEIEGMESPQARKSAYEAAVERQFQRVQSLGGAKSEYEVETLAELERNAATDQRAYSILEVSLLNYLGRPTPAPVPIIQSTTPAVIEATDGVQETPYQNMISRAAPKRTTFADDDDDVENTTASTQQPAKRRKTRKSRTDVADNSSSSSSSEEDSSSDSDSDSESGSPDDDQHAEPGLQTSSKPPSSKPKPIFDKELLDAAFPNSRVRNEKARALAEQYAASESGSESGSEDSSEIESDSDSDSDSDDD